MRSMAASRMPSRYALCLIGFPQGAVLTTIAEIHQQNSAATNKSRDNRRLRDIQPVGATA
jgi:hypothetical protein